MVPPAPGRLVEPVAEFPVAEPLVASPAALDLHPEDPNGVAVGHARKGWGGGPATRLGGGQSVGGEPHTGWSWPGTVRLPPRPSPRQRDGGEQPKPRIGPDEQTRESAAACPRFVRGRSESNRPR